MLVSIGCNDTAKGCDVTDIYDVTLQCTYILWKFSINEFFTFLT